MNAQNVPALAIAASQTGPDFYAVLLITVVAGAAGTLLLRAQRAKPTLSAEKLRPFRWFFYVSCGCGFVAAAISIGWWLYRQTHGFYTAQIAITSIAPNVKIDSRYFSKTSFHLSAGDGSLIADEFFLIVSDHPFSPKDNFAFDVFVIPAGTDATGSSSCPSGGLVAKRKSITIPFGGDLTQSYSLDLDASLSPVLKSASTRLDGAWFSGSEIAYAGLASPRGAP